MTTKRPLETAFGLAPAVLIHEDPDVVDRVIDTSNVIEFFASSSADSTKPTRPSWA